MAHLPEAPKLADLPEPLSRSTRRGVTLADFDVSLRVVTPILGGAARTRTIDEVDVIRAPSVRGNLRFWWRALRGHEFSTPTKLYEAESALWGRAADDTGGRSQVEVRINVKIASNIIEDDINLNDPGAYALWPARGEGKNKSTGQYRTPPAPRRQPGTGFSLSVRCPQGRDAEVRDAVRAWILFGGYGGRTRRGLGSLTVVDGREDWLPEATGAADLRDGVRKLFGRDVFVADAQETASDLPLLAGAALLVGKPEKDAEKAWLEALGWLQEFRQGTSSGARTGGGGGRPGRSNWPEPDKVRQLSTLRSGLKWAHEPQHNAEPAWPRAGFGLPIIGQFQQLSRKEKPPKKGNEQKLKGGKKQYFRWDELDPPSTEPDGFQLQWIESGRAEPNDRLASPLIVKALPLADGRFLPCALWLNRVYPKGGKVVLARNDQVVTNSAAPFDRLVAPDEKAKFKPLDGKSSLREAFLDWLATTRKAERVAP